MTFPGANGENVKRTPRQRCKRPWSTAALTVYVPRALATSVIVMVPKLGACFVFCWGYDEEKIRKIATFGCFQK